MSTKTSIGYGDRFHLYREAYDHGNVYLEVTGGEFRTASNWEGMTYVSMVLPESVMEEIAKAWIARERRQDDDIPPMPTDIPPSPV